MAVHARNPRVRTVQVGGIFRLHDGMAQTSAEGVGVCEEVGIIIDKGEKDSEERAARKNEGESLSVARVVQVENGKRQYFRGTETASASTFPKQPVNEDEDTTC